MLAMCRARRPRRCEPAESRRRRPLDASTRVAHASLPVHSLLDLRLDPISWRFCLQQARWEIGRLPKDRSPSLSGIGNSCPSLTAAGRALRAFAVPSCACRTVPKLSARRFSALRLLAAQARSACFLTCQRRRAGRQCWSSLRCPIDQGLGSPLPHLHRDSAHPGHICTGIGPAFLQVVMYCVSGLKIDALQCSNERYKPYKVTCRTLFNSTASLNCFGF